MQELIDMMVSATANGAKVLWADFRDGLTPKQYNQLSGAYKNARANGLVHREVVVGEDGTELYLVSGDYREGKNQPISGGE